MIERAGDRFEVRGAMTLDEATALLAQGTAALTDERNVFDLSGVTDVDSSGLAVVFGWLRAARTQGRTVAIANPPKNLLSLADVYGVADLLPVA